MKLYPEAAFKYADESGRVRTKASRATAMQQLRRLQNLNPDLEVGQFEYRHLHAFCLHAKADGERPAMSSIRQRRNSVRSFFTWAHFMDILPNDPSAKLIYGVKVNRLTQRPNTWLTEPQIARLLASGSDDIAGRRERVLLMTALLTGLRCFELAALRWSKFTHDLEHLAFIGKASKPAMIALPPQLIDELRSWRTLSEDTDVVLPALRSINNFGDSADSELIVDWHRPLGTAGIRTIVGEAGKRINIPALRPHDLRRSYAGILEARGTPIRDIQVALRHGDLTTTDIYLEKNPARAGAVTKAFTLNLDPEAR